MVSPTSCATSSSAPASIGAGPSPAVRVGGVGANQAQGSAPAVLGSARTARVLLKEGQWFGGYILGCILPLLNLRDYLSLAGVCKAWKNGYNQWAKQQWAQRNLVYYQVSNPTDYSFGSVGKVTFLMHKVVDQHESFFDGFRLRRGTEEAYFESIVATPNFPFL
jgi:hypothetical protein